MTPGMTSFGTKQCRLMAVPANGRALYTFACDRDGRRKDIMLKTLLAETDMESLQVLVYVESHHWIFGALAGGYVFYLHDRAVHARFDAPEKRLDEVRKRFAVEL